MGYTASTNVPQPRSLQLGDVAVTIVTRPGFEYWDEIDPASALIARHARLEAHDRVLVAPCGHGALAVWAAQQSDAPGEARDTHLIAAQACRATLDNAGLGQVAVIAGLPAVDLDRPPFDVILMRLPKGRHAAHMHLAHARAVLAPGGRLYLAGANSTGIKAVLRDAEALFGRVTVLGYKRGHRVALLTLPLADELHAAPDWLSDGVRPGTFLRQEMQIRGEALTICSRPGVFSWQHLDPGSELLLDHLQVADQDRVVDVGCGCGVIGAWAARQAHLGQATLVDVDAVAVDSARQTLMANNIHNATAVHGDGLTAVSDGLTLIVSNPPFHAGHTIAHHMVEALIAQAPEHLAQSGRLVLVANRFLPYDRQMKQVFGNVVALTSTNKYHVLQSVYDRRDP